jgi:hypothetical protein
MLELGPQTVQFLKGILGMNEAASQAHRLKPRDKTAVLEPPPTPDLSQFQTQFEELKELIRTMRTPTVEKEFYSVGEVAERSQREGITKYTRYTIRQACNMGRIPGAKKSHNRRNWLIPFAAVRQILNEGLPPYPPRTTSVP